MPGLNEIPSGHVDPGETLLEALSREVLEETGLEIKEVISHVNGFDYVSSSGKKVRQVNFFVETSNYNVQLNPEEHSMFFWANPNDESFRDINMSVETKRCVVDFYNKWLAQDQSMWVAIDGIDAVGKTTQLELLKKKLGSELTIKTLPEFSDSPIGDVLKSIISKKEFFSLDDPGMYTRAETALLIADFMFHAEGRKNLFEGSPQLIFSDRGTSSLKAYQAVRLMTYGLGENEAMTWVESFTNEAIRSVAKPNLEIILTLPMDEVVKRSKARGYDLNESEISFLSKVQDIMTGMAKKTGAVIIPVMGLSAEEVNKQILGAVKDNFKFGTSTSPQNQISRIHKFPSNDI